MKTTIFLLLPLLIVGCSSSYHVAFPDNSESFPSSSMNEELRNREATIVLRDSQQILSRSTEVMGDSTSLTTVSDTTYRIQTKSIHKIQVPKSTGFLGFVLGGVACGVAGELVRPSTFDGQLAYVLFDGLPAVAGGIIGALIFSTVGSTSQYYITTER